MTAKKFLIRYTNRKGATIAAEVLVDERDAYLLRNYVWLIRGGNKVYRKPNGRVETLADAILRPDISERVYHLNGNPLDNRRANLKKQAIQGWTFAKNGYQVVAGGKYIGRFKTQEEAEKAYRDNLPDETARARF